MTSRRDFLGLLAAAPLVAPVVAKEMAAPQYFSEGIVGEAFVAARGETLILNRFDAIEEALRYGSISIDEARRMRWAHLGDDRWFIGNVRSPVSETPNRLYGVSINSDGDAV